MHSPPAQEQSSRLNGLQFLASLSRKTCPTYAIQRSPILFASFGFGVGVQVHDPMAQPEDAEREYGIALMSESALLPSDAVILAVPRKLRRGGWPMISRLLKNGRGLVMDVKAKLDRATRPEGVDLWRL